MPRPGLPRLDPRLVCCLLLAIASASSILWFHNHGSVLYYGDAQAHVNIARRVIDSRTPGWNQIGTVWLPLPHLLVLPLVGNDFLWRTGLAGSLVSGACFVAAGMFLFGAARRLFASEAAGWAAAGLLALNPNLLYLQATPMTEPVFLAAFLGLVWAGVRFRESPSRLWAAAGGAAALAGTLTRYEGWFVLPFATLWFFFTAKRGKLLSAVLFAAIAALGPLLWLAHNWWYFGDVLEFYRGPYSARAIQGEIRYPGFGNWPEAWRYFRAAAVLCAGWPLYWIGALGIPAALWKRARWPVLLLALPGVFYVWSLHSAGTPIFVPHLWPNSYYNTRYGLALLPLLALAGGALAALFPTRLRGAAACGLVLIAAAPWLLEPDPERWVTWKESSVNSEARREWTRRTAAYLQPRYRPGAGVLTSFGDMTGIFAAAGIPLRQTLTGDNMPQWEATVRRPDLFLWEEWAVATGGDPVQSAILRAGKRGPFFDRVETIIVKGAPVIEIYRRRTLRKPDANSVYESTR